MGILRFKRSWRPSGNLFFSPINLPRNGGAMKRLQNLAKALSAVNERWLHPRPLWCEEPKGSRKALAVISRRRRFQVLAALESEGYRDSSSRITVYRLT